MGIENLAACLYQSSSMIEQEFCRVAGTALDL